MHVNLKDSLDKIPVFTDKDNNVVEIVNINCIYLEALQIFMDRKLAQITMRIGGCDATGKFHPSHEYDSKIARMNISDPLFSELFVDEQGNMKCNLDEKTFERIYEEGIPGGNKLVWGFEEIEATLNNKVLLKKERPRNGNGNR